MRWPLYLLALSGNASFAQQAALPLPDGAIRRLGTTALRAGGSATTTGFAISPDSTQAAILAAPYLTTWDLKSGILLHSIQIVPLTPLPSVAERPLIPPDSPYTDRRVAWAPDGKSLIVPQRGVLYRFTVPLKDEPTKIPSINLRTGISAVAFAKPDGELFAVSKDGAMHEFRPKTQDWGAVNLPKILIAMDPKRATGHYHIAAGKGVVAMAGEDGHIRMWDPNRRTPLDTIEVPAKVASLNLSADGKWLAVQYLEPLRPEKGEDLVGVELWSIPERKRARQWGLAITDGPLALSADGSRMAFVEWSEGKTVGLFDTATGEKLHTLPVYGSEKLKHMAFLPDGSQLLAVGTGGAMHRWDAKTGKPVNIGDGHRGVIGATLALKDGRTLTGGGDGLICLWDEAGKEVRRFVGHTETVTGLAVSPDGKTLYSSASDHDGSIRAWSIVDGKELRLSRPAKVKVPDDVGPKTLTLSSDGKTLAAGFLNHTRLLAADDFQETARLTAPVLPGQTKTDSNRENHILAARFLTDGRLITMSLARTIRIWDVEKNTPCQTIAVGVRERYLGRSEHTTDFNSFGVSPDGKTVVIPIYPREFDRNQLVFVGFWDLASGKEVGRAEVTFETQLSAVAYTPDGKSVLVGDERNGRIWQVDVASKKVTKTFDSGRHFPRTLAVFPDGKSFVSGGTDTTALVWKLDPK